MSELILPLERYKNKDGTYFLRLQHFQNAWGRQVVAANANREFVNFVRKTFPHIHNEFIMGYISHWNAYDVSAQDLMLIRLSWTFATKELHSKLRKGIPVKKGHYLDPYHMKESYACKTRWEKSPPKFKALKLI